MFRLYLYEVGGLRMTCCLKGGQSEPKTSLNLGSQTWVIQCLQKIVLV